MIVIVGESASGKTSVANELVNTYDFEKMVTYTTREIRANEKNGFDYHFISDAEYFDLYTSGFFAEVATYNGWKYGSAKEEYTGNKVVILTPKGLRSIRKSGVSNIFSVYLEVPRRDRLIKILERGDDVDEAYRRNLSDLGQFDGIADEVDLVIKNPKYERDLADIANEIYLKLKGQHERD